MEQNHRQYPDDTLTVKDYTDKSYEDFQRKAVEWKCTREDPQVFHIYHIYCDTLENIPPIKYERNSYLDTMYGDFFLSVAFSELKKTINHLGINIEAKVEDKPVGFLYENKTILTAKSNEDLGQLQL